MSPEVFLFSIDSLRYFQLQWKAEYFVKSVGRSQVVDNPTSNDMGEPMTLDCLISVDKQAEESQQF